MDKEAEKYAERFVKATERLCKKLKFSKEECETAKESSKKYWSKVYLKKRGK